jgi:hypothetical protein
MIVRGVLEARSRISADGYGSLGEGVRHEALQQLQRRAG